MRPDGQHSNDRGFAPVAADIIANQPPAMSRLYAGQAVQDIAGFAAMTDPANFSSSVGSIASVVVTFTGSALDESTELAEDDIAGFSVTVRDSVGNENTFDAEQIIVEFKVSIHATASNEIQIDVNGIVPDSEVLTVIIDSGNYAGTYTPTAGDLRDVYTFPGTLIVTGGTAIGETLILGPGLWSKRCNWHCDGSLLQVTIRP